MQNGKPQFHYHQISKEQADTILALDAEVNHPKAYWPIPMTHTTHQKAINNDLETNGSGLESEKEGAGINQGFFNT